MNVELKDPIEVRDQKVGYAYALSSMKGVRHVPGINFQRIYQKENPAARPVVITPHINNTSIPINFLLWRLGCLTGTDLPQLKEGKPTRVMAAQAITGKTIKLGVKYSPEGVCFPFKVTMGYIAQRIQEFADIDADKRKDLYPLILVHESTGKCRERYYHLDQETRLEDVVEEIPKNKGSINFDMYAVKDSFAGVTELIMHLIRLSGRGGNPITTAKGIKEVWGLMNETILRYKMIQHFEDRVRYYQSLVASGNPNHPGDQFWALDKRLEDTKLLLVDPNVDPHYDSPKSFFAEIEREVKRREDLLRSESLSHLRRETPIGKIAIIGEILHAEDVGLVSGNIGRNFTSQGFYYEKHSGLSGYIDKFDASMRNIFRLLLSKGIGLGGGGVDQLAVLAAQGGLTHDIGGHGRETISYIMEEINLRLAGGWNYDAFFEAKPFQCSPQITAETILRKKMGEEGVIYLPMSFDEQAGLAGVATRIEAFCDQAKKSPVIWERARVAKGDYKPIRRHSSATRGILLDYTPSKTY